jgi:lysophospholipase L1-like esterase
MMLNVHKLKKLHTALCFSLLAAVAFLDLQGTAQEIVWTGPIGITGDANLSTNGSEFDALILNTSAASGLAAAGVFFNIAANRGSGVYGDGPITYTGAGLNNYSWAGAFPTGSQASAAFAAIMDAGGIYQFSGTGTGTITLTNLQPGFTYAVQVFNFAPDGDPGLTTFSGSPSVTLNNLPGSAGAGTSGEFATGTFVATNTSESFTWLGAGSSYTVVGAVSVRNLSITPIASPGNTVVQGSNVTLLVAPQVLSTLYQWRTDGGSGGANWTNISGANTNSYVLNTTGLLPGNYQYEVVITNSSLNLTSAPVTVTVQGAPAQAISWGNAVGITGDADLSAAGSYFDALMLNTSVGAVSAAGVHFNASASLGGGSYGDGIISYTGSGLNNFSWPNSFPTSSQASSAFASLMDDGSIYQFGGNGTGTVTISGLSFGHLYQIQVFNYAPDGDAGLTILSGAIPVSLSNLPGSGGIGTYGEFATGTFYATNATEFFNWSGAGSSYTVMGCISIRDVSAAVFIFPTNVTYQGNTITLEANSQPINTIYQWQTDNGSGGANWTPLPNSNTTNYVLNTAGLSPMTYNYRVVISNAFLNVTGALVSLTVFTSTPPIIAENPTPSNANPFVGQAATFTAAFTGNLPITNQWQVSHDNGLTFTNIPLATNAAITLSNLQIDDTGWYRLMGVNSYGTNDTVSATLTVRPWSSAQIQWSGPFSIIGQTAGQILTNISGNYLEAASFFNNSSASVQAGDQQFVFRSDSVSASISNAPFYEGVYITNAIYGSGAFGTNSTGDAAFDDVLNQYYDGGYSNIIILNNLVPGQTYLAQLFALDNRPGMGAETVNFANLNDTNDISPQFNMSDNTYLVATFTASNTNQSIVENMLSSGGYGNINAVVVRALSYSSSVLPTIVSQPKQSFSLPDDVVYFRVIADGSPSPTYQWKGGPTGGPYTNLVNDGRFSGATTRTLAMRHINTNDSIELVVAITNSAGGVVSTPIDLAVQVKAQPHASMRPVRVTCVGASDVASPTPYGTQNWPDMIAPMLGYEYVITNCGASGTTMMRKGNLPYWTTQQYTNSLNSAPDIVIIMLGSNDSNPSNWPIQTNYTPDYESLINQYRNLPSHPRIYLNTLLSVYSNGNFGITDPIVTGQLCPIIRQIAADEKLSLIDVNAATKNMPENFPDNVHPNIAGAKVVATTVFNGLMNAGEAVPIVDRAQNQPAVASSFINGNAATNAVDSDYTTMWSSAASDNQWIYVDLGSTFNLEGVYLNWGPHYGADYILQVSVDAVNWTGVYTNNSGTGGIDRISLNAVGRYVRLLGIHSGPGNGYDLRDFTVTTAIDPPAIQINGPVSNSFAISWPSFPSSYALVTASNLQPPVIWMPVTNSITVTNGSNCASIFSAGKNAFFQLMRQY